MAGSFAAVRCVTASARSRLVQQWSGKMHTAGLKGKPLAAIQPEIRKEWLQTLDRAFEGRTTLSVGLAQAMKTLEALQSETSASETQTRSSCHLERVFCGV